MDRPNCEQGNIDMGGGGKGGDGTGYRVNFLSRENVALTIKNISKVWSGNVVAFFSLPEIRSKLTL